MGQENKKYSQLCCCVIIKMFFAVLKEALELKWKITPSWKFWNDGQFVCIKDLFLLKGQGESDNICI